MLPGGVSYLVGILVFQGGDWDDIYAVGALVGGVTRDFAFPLREILTFQPVRFLVFITRDFVFAIKADFYISMSRYGRLHSGDMKIPRGVMTSAVVSYYSLPVISVFLPDFFFNISIITVTAPPISNNAPTDIPIISISGVSSLTSNCL